MTTYKYKYADKTIRFINDMPIAQDIGGALGLPSSAVDGALQLVAPDSKITAPLSVLDPLVPLDPISDPVLTVLPNTPTGVGQFLAGLGLALAVATALQQWVDNTQTFINQQRRRKKRHCECVVRPPQS